MQCVYPLECKLSFPRAFPRPIFCINVTFFNKASVAKQSRSTTLGAQRVHEPAKKIGGIVESSYL